MSTTTLEVTALPGEQQRLVEFVERTGSPALASVLRGMDPIHGEPITSERDRVDWISTCLMDAYRQSGEAEALAMLFEMHRDAFLRTIQHFMPQGRRPVEPEDVLHDTFAAFCRYPHHFLADRPAAFRNWGYRILRNTTFRSLRSARKGVANPVDLDALPECADEHAQLPSQAVVDREAAPLVDRAYVLMLGLYQRCFEQMPERDRRLLTRIEVEGCAYRRIAADDGVSTSVVKVRAFRCRKRLLARIDTALRDLAAGESPASAGMVAATMA